MLVLTNNCNKIGLFDLEVYVLIFLFTASRVQAILNSRTTCIRPNDSCFNAKSSHQVQHSPCYNEQMCFKFDPEASCNLFSAFEITDSIIREVRMWRNGQMLQLELALELAPYPVMGRPDSGTFVFEVLVGPEDCRRFFVPTSWIQQGRFQLPCLAAGAAVSRATVRLTAAFRPETGPQELLSVHEHTHLLPTRHEPLSLPTRILRLSRAFDHLKFHLSLDNVTSDQCETSYGVALFEAAGDEACAKPLYSWTGLAHAPLLAVNCSKRFFEHFKRYCVAVSLRPNVTCNIGPEYTRDKFVFQYVPERAMSCNDPLCGHWNVSMLLQADTSARSLSVHLRLCAGMESLSGCFHSYLLHLLLVRNGECRPSSGIRTHSLPLRIPRHQTVSSEFSDLSEGHYCVLLAPCCSEARCRQELSLHSNVVRLYEEKPLGRGVHEHPSTTTRDLTLILAAAISSSVFVICIVAAVLLLRRRRKQKVPKSHSSVVPESSVEKDESVCGVRVLLLHYPERATARRVAALRDFLRDCAGFKVTLGEELLPGALVNRGAALSAALAPNEGRIVVVESRAAARRLREESWKKRRRQEADELERGLFVDAVRALLCDPQRRDDYRRVFVVRFDDPRDPEEEVPLAPCDRYRLPRDLGPLCRNMGAHQMINRTQLAHRNPT